MPKEYHEDLRACFDAFMSSREAAEFVNEKYNLNQSRNAVIGAWARAGLARTRDQINQLQRVVKLRKRGDSGTKKFPLLNRKPVEAMKGLSLLQLTTTTCRWPIEACAWPRAEAADQYAFCGRDECDVLANRPYCREHAKLAIAPRLRGKISVPRSRDSGFEKFSL